jgi:hypothetical protein
MLLIPLSIEVRDEGTLLHIVNFIQSIFFSGSIFAAFLSVTMFASCAVPSLQWHDAHLVALLLLGSRHTVHDVSNVRNPTLIPVISSPVGPCPRSNHTQKSAYSHTMKIVLIFTCLICSGSAFVSRRAPCCFISGLLLQLPAP